MAVWRVEVVVVEFGFYSLYALAKRCPSYYG